MYKLIQFLKDYINLEGIGTSIEIRSHKAQNWLYKLKYEYENVRKDVSIDEYKRSDVVKNLKPYMVEFEKNCAIKTEIYPSDCVMEGDNHRPIIVITHDDVIFLPTMKFEDLGLKLKTFFYDPKVVDKARWQWKFYFLLIDST